MLKNIQYSETLKQKIYSLWCNEAATFSSVAEYFSIPVRDVERIISELSY